MSFYKNYPNRKDRRGPYYDTRQFDAGCKNHGSCDWCKGNRTHKNARRAPIVEDEYKTLV